MLVCGDRRAAFLGSNAPWMASNDSYDYFVESLKFKQDFRNLNLVLCSNFIEFAVCYFIISDFITGSLL